MPDEWSLGAQWKRLYKATKAGQHALAVLRARRLLDDFPEFDHAWSYLGVELTSLARYDEAEEALTKAIAFGSDEARCIRLCNMGHMFREQGDYDRAAEWYREAIDAAPHHASAHVYLGAVLAKQGRLREAEEVHRRAIACEEGCIDEAYLNLGFVLRAQERFSEAAECFRETIRLDPHDQHAKKALRDVERCLRFANREAE